MSFLFSAESSWVKGMIWDGRPQSSGRGGEAAGDVVLHVELFT